MCLEQLGFTVIRDEAFSDTIAEGVVISAAPEVGTSLPVGSEVTITVSKGVQYFEVPDVVESRCRQCRRQASGRRIYRVRYQRST
ncbi:MAG: PASTA domain-containing protein [Acidimicrobiales bacterium]